MFRELHTEMHLSTAGVTARFLKSYQANRNRMDLAWQLFLQQLDYGYDSSLETITPATATRRLGRTPLTVNVDVRKGWQATGIVLPANASIHIAARGRFEVGRDSAPWICEPQGITLEYYQGRPLGTLLATIIDPELPNSSSPFDKTTAVGRNQTLSTAAGGQLYLRINERVDRMRDNRGSIAVTIKLEKKQ